MRFVIAVDPGFRNLGIALLRGSSDDIDDCTILHVSSHDLAAGDPGEKKKGKKRRKGIITADTSLHADWEPSRLHDAFEAVWSLVPPVYRNRDGVTFIMERQFMLRQSKFYEPIVQICGAVIYLVNAACPGVTRVCMSAQTRIAAASGLGGGGGTMTHYANHKKNKDQSVSMAILEIRRMYTRNPASVSTQVLEVFPPDEGGKKTNKKRDDMADALLMALTAFRQRHATGAVATAANAVGHDDDVHIDVHGDVHGTMSVRLF